MDANTGTTPPPPDPGPAAPPVTGTDSFFDAIRRSGLVRSDERWIGGVAGGLALRLRVDPAITRGVLALSVLLGGLGLVAYGVGWLLLPEQRDSRIHLQQLFRGDFDPAVIGGFLVLLAGFAFPDRWFPGAWWGDHGWWNGLSGLAVAAVVITLVVAAARSGPGGGVPTTTLPPRPPGGRHPAPPYAGPTQTHPTQGHPTQQYPTQQYPTQQYPAQQYPTQQYPTEEATPMSTTAPAAPPAGPDAPGWYGPPGPGGPAGPGGPGGPGRPAPTALPRPRAQGPGPTAVGVVVALGLLTLAGLLYASRTDAFDGPVLLTAAAVLVALAGIGIVVSGLAGRTSGGLGGLAVVTLLVVVPVAGVSDLAVSATGTVMGEATYRPTDPDVAEDGYNLGLGKATIDLTELPTAEPVDVPIRVGAGEVIVLVPEGSAFEAEVSIGAGEVVWLDEGSWDGVGQDLEVFRSAAVERGADADIRLDITVGAGSVRVVEEGSR